MIKLFLLNTVSVLFKTISFINLKLKSLKEKKYKNTYIISVDNISFGGTGKTPLVIKIGRELKRRNIKFSIITRGYKSKYEKTGIKVTDSHGIEDIGDEALLFRKYFPDTDIYIGKNRKKSIEKSINNNNRIIILDDGFQTKDVHKDLKIMLLNPKHKYYYLRNFKFLIKKEDIILTMSENLKIDNSYNFVVDGIYDTDEKQLKNISNKRVIGFSALGDNDRFKKTLKKQKFKIINFKSYNDHFSYNNKVLKHLNDMRKESNCSYLICSEKDFIKIKNLNLTNIPLIYIKNRIQLNINLVEIIIRNAEKKGIIKT